MRFPFSSAALLLLDLVINGVTQACADHTTARELEELPSNAFSDKFSRRHAQWLLEKRKATATISSDVHHFEQYTENQWQQASSGLKHIRSDFDEATHKKADFASECKSYLLSDEVISDLKISQVDATKFLVYYSIKVGMCSGKVEDECTNVNFEALEVILQLAFVWAICPYDTINGEDEVCLTELDDQGYEFGWVINEEDFDFISAEVENYCMALWSYADDFHGGTIAPSHRPSMPNIPPTSAAPPSVSPTEVSSSKPTRFDSSGPSYLPSIRRSLSPTQSSAPSSVSSKMASLPPSARPTFRGVSSSPSTSPHGHPSRSPSISPLPSVSVVPSSAPSSRDPYGIKFSYVLGFNDTNVTAQTLDDAYLYVDIMDEVRQAIRRVLALSDVTRMRRMTLRKLDVVLMTNDPLGSIFHRQLRDEDCPIEFEISQNCVRVVTEVLAFANSERYTKQEVENQVLAPIRSAMESDQFIDSIDRQEVKEVKYLSEEAQVNDDGLLTEKDGILNNTGIAGIAIGSIFIVGAIILFAVGRSRANDDRGLVELAASDSYSEDLDSMMDVEPGGGIKMRSAPDIGDYNMTFEPESITKAAQLDVDTGDVIAAVHANSVASKSSASSSDYSDSQGSTDADAEALIGRLDAAVSLGDWAAVAVIAGDLSTADEASTFSSAPSKYSANESRGALTDEDKKRAEKIDKLVSIGDWNAVGATAAAFDSDSSASGSFHTAGLEKSSLDATDEKKKSILDFIAGPWQSTAASKAMAQDEEVEESDTIQKSAESDGISSISGGFSPARNIAISKELSHVEDFSLPIEKSNEVLLSESSGTEDDQKPMLPPSSSTKKKGWKGRLPFLSGKVPSADKAAVNSLALQEDSSASSWSHGSSPVNSFNPYVGANNSLESSSKRNEEEMNMPKEMKVFGEDFGLQAANFAMQREENEEEAANADDENSTSPRSKGSVNSLQNDLDKAIESGDWAAVEAQTNKLFDMSMDIANMGSPDDNNISQNVSTAYEDSSFVDDDSHEGWSTGSKSHTTTDSEQIDDERIAMLEKLIETDDWQGIVTSSEIHNREDSSMANSDAGDELLQK